MFHLLLVEQVLDEALLRHAEGDDAAGLVLEGRVEQALDDGRDDGLRLLAVGARLAAVVDAALDLDAAHAEALAGDGGRREREELAAVVALVGEGDERFVARAVVPQQRLLGHARGLAFVEDAVEVLDGVLVRLGVLRGAGIGLLEEVRGRELLRVADDDRLLAAREHADGVPHGELRGFVEHDDVEAVALRRQILRDRERAHEQARLENGQQPGQLLQERARRQLARLLGDLVVEKRELGEERGVLLRLDRAQREARENHAARKVGDLLVEAAEGRDERVLAVAEERAQRLVRVEHGADEPLAVALAERGRAVRGGERPGGDGGGDRRETALFARNVGLAPTRPFAQLSAVFDNGFRGGAPAARPAFAGGRELAGTALGGRGERGDAAAQVRFGAREGGERAGAGRAVRGGLGELRGESFQESAIVVARQVARGPRRVARGGPGGERVGLRVAHGVRRGGERAQLGERGLRGSDRVEERGDLVVLRGELLAVGQRARDRLADAAPLEEAGEETGVGLRPAAFEGIQVEFEQLRRDERRLGRAERGPTFERAADGFPVGREKSRRQRRCRREQVGEAGGGGEARVRERFRVEAERVAHRRGGGGEGVRRGDRGARGRVHFVREGRRPRRGPDERERVEKLGGHVARRLGERFDERLGFREAAFAEWGVGEPGDGRGELLVRTVREQIGERAVGREAAGMRLVQGADVGVELAARGAQLRELRVPRLGRRRARVGERLGELAQHVRLARLVGVQLQAERREADLAQAALHHFEGGALLGDEEDRAPRGHARSDQVRDRLRLAGAGRTVQDEIAAALRGEDGGELRGVGRERAERLRLVADAVHLRGLHGRDAVVKRAAALHEVRDDGRLREVVQARREVLPHEELAEREAAEPDFGEHLPAFERAHRGAERREDGVHVDAVFVRRERVDARRRDAVLALEHLEERDVDDRVVVRRLEREAGLRGKAREQHGQEQDRRAVDGRLVALAVFPLERAEREEERVGAAFLQVGARGAVERKESRVGLRAGGRRDVEPVVFGLGGEEVLRRVGRQLQDLVGLALRERVLEARRELELQTDGVRPLLEIEQAVAARKVEQLRAPALDAGRDAGLAGARALGGGPGRRGRDGVRFVHGGAVYGWEPGRDRIISTRRRRTDGPMAGSRASSSSARSSRTLQSGVPSTSARSRSRPLLAKQTTPRTGRSSGRASFRRRRRALDSLRTCATGELDAGKPAADTTAPSTRTGPAQFFVSTT